MHTDLFNQIRYLTQQAIILLNEDKIEQCNIVLAKRQSLLEELKSKHDACLENKKEFTDKFVELMKWIQQQDTPAIINATDKKSQTIKNSLTQIKTKKALQQYKNAI